VTVETEIYANNIWRHCKELSVSFWKVSSF